jgi:hypothetical protein
MSSTDERNLLDDFFRRHLLPLSRLPGWKRSDPAPDPQLSSYYRVRQRERMQERDFEIPLRDMDAIANSLDSFWRGSQLAGLGKLLMKLGRHFVGREQKKEVSSDIYEMF